MDDSPPEAVSLPLAPASRAGLAGFGLAMVALVSGGGLLSAEGGVVAAAGVAAMLALALGAGIWAGAPGAAATVAMQRWLAAGLLTGASGVMATLWEVVPGFAGGVAGLMLTVLVGVGLPAYAIGLLAPVLALEVEADEPESPLLAAGVVALGGLAGFTAGAVLVGALWGLVPAGPFLLGTGAALVFPAMMGLGERPPAVEERTLVETETPFGTVRVAEVVYPAGRQPERRLYVDDEEESGQLVRSGAPTLAYIAAAEQWLAAATPRGASYLFLGGGAYTLPRRIAESDPRARITVVERDPEITRIAYRHFSLRPEHGIESLHGDARAWLERLGEPVDRIFVDVYDGREQLPYSVVTLEAMRAAAALLRPDGILVANAIGVVEGPGAMRFWSVVRTLAEAFPSVAVYAHLGRDYPDRQNVLLCGSPAEDRGFPDRAGYFELWAREEWPEVQAVVLHDRLIDGGPE
jgi:predicted O-methyltransferase YrrM